MQTFFGTSTKNSKSSRTLQHHCEHRKFSSVGPRKPPQSVKFPPRKKSRKTLPFLSTRKLLQKSFEKISGEFWNSFIAKTSEQTKLHKFFEVKPEPSDLSRRREFAESRSSPQLPPQEGTGDKLPEQSLEKKFPETRTAESESRLQANFPKRSTSRVPWV